MRKSLFRGILFLLAASAAWTIVGCSKPDTGGENIATVNGDEIKVRELREFLGVRGEGVQASEVPVEQKREALDRLVAGRLLAGDARAKGLDNTDEFRNGAKQNEDVVLIAALFQKEVSKLQVPKGDVEAEAKKLKAADKTLSDEAATARGRRQATDSKMRKIEEDLVAAARKEAPATVNQAELDKLAKGGKLADETVLATVGAAKITYGDVKAQLRKVSGGTHGGQDLSNNAVAVARMLERETIGKGLVALARKQGVAGSEWEKAARQNMERSMLIDMVAEKETGKTTAVSDKDVAEAYSQHGEMFVRDGKKIPFAQIKEQIRVYLQREKRKKALEAYVGELKKKAKITVNEGLFPKV